MAIWDKEDYVKLNSNWDCLGLSFSTMINPSEGNVGNKVSTLVKTVQLESLLNKLSVEAKIYV